MQLKTQDKFQFGDYSVTRTLISKCKKKMFKLYTKQRIIGVRDIYVYTTTVDWPSAKRRGVLDATRFLVGFVLVAI